MNTLTKIMTGMTLTTLMCFTGAVPAQDAASDPADPVRKSRHHQRGDRAMPAVGNMMRAIRHLDLSDEQKTSIKTIMQHFKIEERLLKQEMKAGHEQLKELIKAESFDESAVAALAETEGALAAERLIVASRAMSEVYGQLTVEQRAELEIMASERAERRAEKRERRPDKG